MSTSYDWDVARARLAGTYQLLPAESQGADLVSVLLANASELATALIVAEKELRETAAALETGRRTPRKTARLQRDIFGDAHWDIELSSTADRICDTLALYGPQGTAMPRPSEVRA